MLKTIRKPYIDKDFKNVNDSMASEENQNEKNTQRNEVFTENKNNKTTTTVSLDKSTNMGIN